VQSPEYEKNCSLTMYNKYPDMNQEMIDLIANLLSPYLKTKHKDIQAHELAKKILEEIDKNSPS